MGISGSHISDHMVGKRLKEDAFNKNNVLLVPASTVLNHEHIQLLYVHNIDLSENDVEIIGPFGGQFMNHNGALVDEAIGHVKNILQDVRLTKKVSVAEIRKKVIPFIMEITEDPNLFDLFATLQSKNDYVYRHSFAVGVIATLLGKWKGMPEAELLQLATSALLLDVGKMLIDEAVLNIPGRLSDDEFALIKRHTVLGYELLNKTVGMTHRQTMVALQHHERLDGSGYPFGIHDAKIDLFSRIVAVADVFHAMSSDKIYRTSSPFYEVLTQLESFAYGKLDPAIVYLLIDKNMRSMVGHEVVLSTGEKGKIVMINPHSHTRPLVQTGDTFIDLSKNNTVNITQVLF